MSASTPSLDNPDDKAIGRSVVAGGLITTAVTFAYYVSTGSWRAGVVFALPLGLIGSLPLGIGLSYVSQWVRRPIEQDLKEQRDERNERALKYQRRLAELWDEDRRPRPD